MTRLHGLFLLALTAALAALPTTGRAAEAATYQNPVIAGDFPDPSVIRIGREYWLTATSSEWGPPFPLLRSRDLVNWDVLGTVFTNRPAWSVGNYWAPELWEYKKKFYVYYVARKKDGPLHIGVGTAEKPGGPYTDHGPMVGQAAGSIDPVPVLNERGEPYLIWKEDGNSQSRPTPLWLQKLSPDGLQLVGEMQEILRNDAPWEGNLIEGPFVLRRAGWFYLFYSGNACCGRRCNYALGVARARTLTGPWEKNPANPILQANDHWKCPGHGTIVSDGKGRDFLMYHAYDSSNTVYVGRQALLDEVRWAPNGWPTINGGKGPSLLAAAPLNVPGRNSEHTFFDDFTDPKLSPVWHWPQADQPLIRLVNGQLHLRPLPGPGAAEVGSVLAVKTTTGNYAASVLIDLRQFAGGSAGISAFGDRENALGLTVGDGKAAVWRIQKNKREVLSSTDLVQKEFVYLRMNAQAGHRFGFSLSGDGKAWTVLREGAELTGDYLPPWDRGVRVALVAGGTPETNAKFDWFLLLPE